MGLGFDERLELNFLQIPREASSQPNQVANFTVGDRNEYGFGENY